MKRYVKSVSIIGVFIAAMFIISMAGEFAPNKSGLQVTFAHTAVDKYIYLPIIINAPDPEYKIVFASDRERNWQVYDIFTMNMEGEHVNNLTNTPDIPESYPVWSPDGTMIAFLVGEENQEELYIMNADGSNRRNLSNSPNASDRRPVWSPDSEKIGFMSDRDDQPKIYDVFVVNVNGTGLTNLTNSSDTDEWSMDWSPDGSKIVYLADKSLHPTGLIGHIMTMNADGSNKRTVFTDMGFNYNPVWTPDGSKITFNFFSGCLAMIDADGSNADKCFTSPPELDGMEDFKWNGTGLKLAYIGFLNGSSDKLYIYDLVTQQSTNVAINIPGFYPNKPYDWSPDGTHIILGEDKGNGGDDIAIVKADGSDYRKLTDSSQDEDRWADLSPIKLP